VRTLGQRAQLLLVVTVGHPIGQDLATALDALVAGHWPAPEQLDVPRSAEDAGRVEHPVIREFFGCGATLACHAPLEVRWNWTCLTRAL